MSITSVLKFVPSSLISLWPFDLRRSILQDISGDLDAMVSHNHAKSTHSPADFRETTSARCKWMTQFQTGLFVFFCITDIDPTHLDNETCLHHVQQEIHVQKIQKIYFSLAILLYSITKCISFPTMETTASESKQHHICHAFAWSVLRM